MKKLIILALSALSISSFGQSTIQIRNIDNNTVLAPNATVHIATFPSDNFKVNLDIKNTHAANTQYYIAKRYNVVINDQAASYFCFAGNCYDSSVYTSPYTLTLTAGQSASQIVGSFNTLTADLDEGPVVDTSIVRYSFINTNNAADSVQITLYYNAHLATVGLKESAKSAASFEIFPNPVKETASIRISSAKSFESTLVVFNSLGETVYRKNISITEGKNKIEVPLENLPSGVYFTSIRDGETLISKKLIKN